MQYRGMQCIEIEIEEIKGQKHPEHKSLGHKVLVWYCITPCITLMHYFIYKTTIRKQIIFVIHGQVVVFVRSKVGKVYQIHYEKKKTRDKGLLPDTNGLELVLVRQKVSKR